MHHSLGNIQSFTPILFTFLAIHVNEERISIVPFFDQFASDQEVQKGQKVPPIRSNE